MSWLASLLLIFVTIFPPSLALGADAGDSFLDCLQRTSDFSEMSDKELLRLLKGVRGYTNTQEFLALETSRQAFEEVNERVRSENRPYRPSEIKIYGESLFEILKLSRVAYKLNDKDPEHIVVEILPIPYSKDDPEKFTHPLNRFAAGLKSTQGTTLAVDLDPNRKIHKNYVASHDPLKKMVIASNDMISNLLPTLHEGHEVIHALGSSMERDLITLGATPQVPRMLIRVQDALDDGYEYVQAFWNDEAASHAYTLSFHSADLARWAKQPNPTDPRLQAEVEKKLVIGLKITGRIKRRLERSEDQIQDALSQIPKLSVSQLLNQRLKSNADGTCTYLVQTSKNATRSIVFFPSKAMEKALDAIEMLPDTDLSSKNPFQRPSAQAEAVRLEVVRVLSEELKTELTAVQKARASHQVAFTFFQQRRIGDEYTIDQRLIDAFRKPYQEFNEQRQKDRERVRLRK